MGTRCILLLLGLIFLLQGCGGNGDLATSPAESRPTGRKPATDDHPTGSATKDPATQGSATKSSITGDSVAKAANISSCVSSEDGPVDDPSVDGWTTEVFSSRAGKQLKQLLLIALTSETAGTAEFAEFVTGDAASSDFPPTNVLASLSRKELQIRRWNRSDAAGAEQSREPLGDALARLRKIVHAQHEPHVKVKVVRVDQDAAVPSTKVLIAIDDHHDDRNMQLTATLECSWDISDELHPRLKSIVAEKYEESTLTPGQWFREYTPSIMENVEAYQSQLLFNDDHWAKRIEETLGSSFMGYQGVTIGDVNGDLLDDLYLCQSGGLPNRLLIQQPDGTLQDVSQPAGVDFLDSCRCALLLDLDNDGDQDLVIASITGTLFLENTRRSIDKSDKAGTDDEANVQFVLRRRFPGSALGYTLTAADYDQDGDLDVYAACYHPPKNAEFANPLPYHDANNGSPNYLLRNDGDFAFQDATNDVGLNQNNRRWTYSACFHDFDNDGDADLYVANDFGRNCLYRNEDGKFTDIASSAGVEDTASGMSVTWADVNRDGLSDVYVSNMFSSAGGRITYQQKFKPDARGDAKSKIQRLARGNTLYLNQGNGTFTDATLEAGVEMGRWAWSSNFVDLDNDGWEDLMVANGNYTGDDADDL